MTAWQSRVADDERTLRNEVKLQVTRETFVGLPQSAPLIAANVRKLGFEPRDVRLIQIPYKPAPTGN
jgi:hypothetical protein